MKHNIALYMNLKYKVNSAVFLVFKEVTVFPLPESCCHSCQSGKTRMSKRKEKTTARFNSLSSSHVSLVLYHSLQFSAKRVVGYIFHKSKSKYSAVQGPDSVLRSGSEFLLWRQWKIWGPHLQPSGRKPRHYKT